MNRGNSVFSESFYSLPSAELLQATHTPTVERSAGAEKVSEVNEGEDGVNENAEGAERVNESAEDTEAKANIEFVYFLHQLFQKMIVAHPPQRDFVDCVSGYITEDNTVGEDDLTSALESYFGVDDDDDIEFFSTLHDVVELSANLFHDDSVALFASLDLELLHQ